MTLKILVGFDPFKRHANPFRRLETDFQPRYPFSRLNRQ
jgi:hypothetical protein